MVYELNTDEFYVYGGLNEAWAYVNTELVLKEPADPVLLQEAAREALDRMPYFKVCVVVAENPERYVLKTNSAPFCIMHADNFLPFDSPEANGYLITVCYDACVVRMRFSHALSDGVGVNRFFRLMMCLYFAKRYGTCEEEAAYLSGRLSEKEYDNPFAYIKMPGTVIAPKYNRAFTFDKNEVSDTRVLLVQITVPAQRFLVFAKENESSVATVGAWILMNAVSSVQEDTDMPIRVAMPFNMRNILECPQNMRNCNIELQLTMHDKMKHRDPAFQLSCLRGQMYAQTYESNCIPLMEHSHMQWLYACRKESIRERKRFYEESGGLDSVPIVVYVGSFALDRYDTYYDHISQYVKVAGQAGIMLSIMCVHDTFHMNLTTNLKNADAYIKGMTDFMSGQGIPSRVLASREV